ncbi:DUF2380 domain-containing protein [Pyxidicoccus sp. 3LG]
MRMWWLALVGLLSACAATTPAMNECEDADEAYCLAPACTEEFCALYRCEDLTPGQVVRTRGSLPVRPPSDSQRYWATRRSFQASTMIQSYNLRGLPGTYWQRFELPPAPPRD